MFRSAVESDDAMPQMHLLATRLGKTSPMYSEWYSHVVAAGRQVAGVPEYV